MAALRNKKNYETQLDKISGVRLTLETQVSLIPDRWRGGPLRTSQLIC